MAISFNLFCQWLHWKTFKLVKWLQGNVIDLFFSVIFGFTTAFGKNVDHEESLDNYESSAQVVNVRWKGSIAFFCLQKLTNFLWTHEKYVSPEWVLDKDHVTLYGVNETHVWFCVTDVKEDVNDLNDNPFVTDAQWRLIKQLVIMPHWAFKRLAKKVGTPEQRGKEFIFITNPARSGSTLLCQIFARLPRTLVLSEPWAVTWAQHLHMVGRINDREYDSLLKDLFILQLKDTNKRVTDRYVLKVTLLSTPQIENVARLFPEAKQIYSARHPRASIVSFYRLLKHPMYELLAQDWPRFWQQYSPLPNKTPWADDLRHHGFLHRNVKKKLFESSSLAYAGSNACLMAHKDLIDYVAVYEDLMENRDRVLKDMFNATNIPEKYISDVHSAFEKHSQGNMYGVASQKDYDVLSKDDWILIDNMFKLAQLPFDSNVEMQKFIAYVSK